jgi:hypothetical protein
VFRSDFARCAGISDQDWDCGPRAGTSGCAAAAVSGADLEYAFAAVQR